MGGLWVPLKSEQRPINYLLSQPGDICSWVERESDRWSATNGVLGKNMGLFSPLKECLFCCHLIVARLGTPYELWSSWAHRDVRLTSLSLLLIVLLASSPPVAYAILSPPPSLPFSFPHFLHSFSDSFIHSWHRTGGREKWEAASDDHTKQQWLLLLPVFRLSAISKSQFKEFGLMNLLLSAPKDSHLLPPVVSTVLVQTPLIMFAILYYYLIPWGLPIGQWTLTGQGLVLGDF